MKVDPPAGFIQKPLYSKRKLLLIVAVLAVLLPFAVWSVQTQRFELRKKAAVLEGTVCWNRVYEAKGGPVWPDSCRGGTSSESACLQVLTPLTENELAQYQAWVLNGKPPIPGCVTPTPSCIPLPPDCVTTQPDGRIVTCDPPPGTSYCPQPTPIPNDCGEKRNGSSCTISHCPTCNPGQPCPLMPCYLQNGLCQEGQCVAIPTPTPTPTPVNDCVGKPDGTTCVLGMVCPVCPPGSTTCPKFPCYQQSGVCRNQTCGPLVLPTPIPNPPPGCYYQQVQCIQAPCNPILVCPTPTCIPLPPCVYGVTDEHGNTVYCDPQPPIGGRYCPRSTATPTISPTPTFTPTPTPRQNVSTLEFRIKFAGVNDGSAEGAGVTARFVRNDINVVTPPIRFTYAENGVYKATVGLSGSLTIPAGPGYTIILKGEKHVARKFCHQGQFQPCIGNESMDLPFATATPVLDFSRLPLDPGDLPPQDGKADSSDFDKIKSLLSKPCSSLTDQDKKTADLDYNGCIDIGDAFLMRKTLETRYDEN